jgi:HSP20 family protein
MGFIDGTVFNALVKKFRTMNTQTPSKKRSSNGNVLRVPALFNDFFSDPFFGGSTLASQYAGIGEVPSANIRENENEYEVELSAPGLKRDDFNIDLDDNVLTISSEKEEERKAEEKDYKRREFSYSSFSRSFTLPDNVADDKINAKYSDGILHVTIPKREATIKKPRKQIKIS